MTTPFNPEQETEHRDTESRRSVFDDQQEATVVGHSGNLRGKMRETPQEEFGPFDNAKDARGDSVLTTPDDPSTMVEYVKEDYERPSAELDPDHPENIQTETDTKQWYQKPATWFAAGALSVGAIFGITSLTGGGDNQKTDPTEITDETVDREGEPASPEVAPTPPTIDREFLPIGDDFTVNINKLLMQRHLALCNQELYRLDYYYWSDEGTGYQRDSEFIKNNDDYTCPTGIPATGPVDEVEFIDSNTAQIVYEYYSGQGEQFTQQSVLKRHNPDEQWLILSTENLGPESPTQETP